MNERHERVLARGLQEFDRTVAKRRGRRVAMSAVAMTAVVVAVGTWALKGVGREPGTPNGIATTFGEPLPAYVQIIGDDDHLIAELELAQACERIDRRDGAVYVVECNSGGRLRPSR